MCIVTICTECLNIPLVTLLNYNSLCTIRGNVGTIWQTFLSKDFKEIFTDIYLHTVRTHTCMLNTYKNFTQSTIITNIS